MSAIIATKKHGISRSQLHLRLQTWPIFSSFSTPALREYYLLFWSAEYFLGRWKEGTIVRNGSIYHVCFAPGLSLAKLKQLDKSHQIALSFRTAAAEYNLPSYVFVSIPV
jgi:hypothetical protein